MLRPDSGSGGGSIETTTTSSTSDDDYQDTIDLGYGGAGGGSNQTVDLEENAAAAVDTSDDIEDAGGPSTVLATTQDQVTEINKAVSDVSGQIRDQEEQQEQQEDDQHTVTDIPQEETARRNAANTGTPEADRSGPQGVFGAIVGVITSLLSAVFGLVGGT